MIKIRQILIGFLLGSMLVLAACNPSQEGIPVTGETAAPEGPSVSPTLPPQVVQNAQQWLAAQIDTAADQVQIVSFEQTEWTDSCLGLGRLNESCLQAITPGWRIVLAVNGVTYEVRTDQTGSVIRLAPSAGADENSLENTHWSLVSFGSLDAGQPPVAGSSISLMMASAQAGGYAGCNSYGGTYEVDGSSLSFGPMTSTLRLCAEEAIGEQEQRYFQALETVTSFERMENFLILRDESGNEVLTFETPLAVVPLAPSTPQ